MSDETKCVYCGDPSAHPGTRKCSDSTACDLRMAQQDAAALRARVAELERERGRLGNDAQQGLANERALHDALLWAHEWHLKDLPSPTPATTTVIERIEQLRGERDELREHTLSLERQVGDLRKMYEKAEAQVTAARAMCTRELEEKLKVVELENERLKKALGTRSLARLKRIESAQAAAQVLRNDETIKPKFCTVCEAPLTPRPGAGRPRKTCSLACAKKRNRILTSRLLKKAAP